MEAAVFIRSNKGGRIFIDSKRKACCNNSLGTNHNIFSVIKAFMNEDALARPKNSKEYSYLTTEPNSQYNNLFMCRLCKNKTILHDYK